MRAKAAPRQWWIPNPKLMGGVVGPADVELLGFVEPGRFAVGAALEHDDRLAPLK